jgi:hypothetical protein
MSNSIAARPAVANLLKKLESGKPRVAFIVDATMSRESTWDLSSRLQAQMFDIAAGVGLELKLIYYRGFNECSASPWYDNAAAIRAMMERIHGQSGHTQIQRSLGHVRTEHARKPIAAAVLISDAFEEVATDVYLEAQTLGVPVFAFQEGDDQSVARVYRRIGKIAGGAFAAFGPGAAQQLAELLRAVSAYAAGGESALEHQGTKGAKLLLAQLRKSVP